MSTLNSVVLKHSIILNNFTALNPHMKFKKALTSLLFFLLIFSAQVAVSQTSYADIKVDELSDAKIREMMQRAESVGYNDAQLEQMAAAQGMKPEEITKLRARVAKISIAIQRSATLSNRHLNKVAIVRMLSIKR